VLVEFALGVSVAQAAGARELLEALRCRREVGWRPNEQGVSFFFSFFFFLFFFFIQSS